MTFTVYGIWNDEYSRDEGGGPFLRSPLYTTRELAEAECARLNAGRGYVGVQENDWPHFVDELVVESEPPTSPPVPTPEVIAEERERMRQAVRRPLPYEEPA